MMSTILLIAVLVFLVLCGVYLAWRLVPSSNSVPPPPGTSEQGYGEARWLREQALWEGTLRRLHMQAARYPEPPAHLKREIAQAEARLARARAAAHTPTDSATKE